MGLFGREQPGTTYASGASGDAPIERENAWMVTSLTGCSSERAISRILQKVRAAVMAALVRVQNRMVGGRVFRVDGPFIAVDAGRACAECPSLAAKLVSTRCPHHPR